jgi:hypothetical protein
MVVAINSDDFFTIALAPLGVPARSKQVLLLQAGG